MNYLGFIIMSILLCCFLKLTLIRAIFDLPFKNCEVSYLSDHYCDLECNNLWCNFDSDADKDLPLIQIFTSSDCLIDCILTGCNLELLDNQECDQECNNEFCAFDLGHCGICASGCTEEKLLDKICDENGPCNTMYCDYDMLECNICVPGCGKSDVLKDKCENDYCKSSECMEVETNPCFDLCASNCLRSKIGDGECHSECNNHMCNYDNGDCDCAPGCNYEERSKDCRNDSDPCDVKACNFKDGKCGFCASGCFESMITNQKCDPECLNPECAYDNHLCECSPGCYMYQTQDSFILTSLYEDTSSCYNPNCSFNTPNSQDDFSKRSKTLSKLMTGSHEAFNISDLPKDCTQDMLIQFDSPNSDKCDLDSPCYTSEALWCMGRGNNSIESCLRSSNKTCFICEGFMRDDQCYSGTSCPEDYEVNSNLTELFIEDSSSFTWCTKSTVGISENNPEMIYVNSSEYLGSSKDGTKENPFASLYSGLKQVSKKYSKIFLSPGKFIFGSEAVDISESTLLSDSSNMELLVIEGSSSETASEVFWSTISDNNPFVTFKIIWKGKMIHIKNIKFNGEMILLKSCYGYSIPECYYCPAYYYFNTVKIGTFVISDKLNIIFPPFDQIYYQLKTRCTNFNNLNFFTFYGDVFISNVEFSNFRCQFNSLIKAYGNLKLENVDFRKVQAYYKGNVVELSCNTHCQNVEFSYQGGLVEDLNYGYEIFFSVASGSFLKIEKIWNAFVEGVDFSFNVVYSTNDQNYESYLISMKEINGTVKISNCSFNNIFSNSLLIFDMTAVKYSSLMIDNKNSSKTYNKVHFELSDSKFENIFSSSDFISYLTKSTTQNIKIQNLSFSNISSSSSSIISLEYLGELQTIDTLGESTKLGQEIGLIYPRTAEISDLTFDIIYTGSYVISIKKYTNLSIKNLKVSELLDGSEENVTEIVKNFEKNGKYLSIGLRADKIGDLGCKGVVLIEESFNIQFDNSYIENIFCESKSSPGGFVMQKITGYLRLEKVNFYKIEAISEIGAVLAVYEIDAEINLKSIKITETINSYGPIIDFYKCKNISIDTLTMYMVTVYIAPPISAYNFKNFIATGIYSGYIMNYNGDCGVISFVCANTHQSIIRVSYSIFEEIFVYGDCGLFKIDS